MNRVEKSIAEHFRVFNHQLMILDDKVSKVQQQNQCLGGTSFGTGSNFSSLLPDTSVPLVPRPIVLSNDEVESEITMGGCSSHSAIQTPQTTPSISTPNQTLKEKSRVEKWVEEGFLEQLTPSEIIVKLNLTHLGMNGPSLLFI